VPSRGFVFRRDLGYMFFSHCQTSDSPSGPTGLKVETSCDAVNIDAFTCEVEVGDNLALHRPEIDFLSADATSRDKLGRHLFFHTFCNK
jgi:hypothetical protein